MKGKVKRSEALEKAVIGNARHIASTGPTRVAERKSGGMEGVRPDRATRRDPLVVVFIRDDGWSLGASAETREEAERLWHDQWIGRMELEASGMCEIVVKDDHGFEYTAGFMDKNGVMYEERDGAMLDEEDDEAEVFGDEQKHTKDVFDVRPEGRSMEEIRKWLENDGESEKAKRWKVTREAIADGRVKIPKDLVTADDFTETAEVFGPDSFPGEDVPHAPAIKKMKRTALPRWYAGITKERGR